MTGATAPTLAWEWHDYRRDETRSTDGRFIAYGYVDDDRMRFALEDTATRTQHDHMFPSMGAAQAHAERIIEGETTGATGAGKA